MPLISDFETRLKEKENAELTSAYAVFGHSQSERSLNGSYWGE
jgi:hypothetical protein